MNISWETLVYQWIFAEVCHANEEFANPIQCSSCITWFVWLVSLIDTGLVKKKAGPKNDTLRKVYLI